MSQSPRVFKITMSERCFRFKPDALFNHAPDKPGIYEFVTFGPAGEPSVLYVGLALEESVRGALAAHLENKKSPSAAELFSAAKDVYFDYVDSADIEALSDLSDIARALALKHKPRFNASEIPGSGRHQAVQVVEVE